MAQGPKLPATRQHQGLPCSCSSCTRGLRVCPFFCFSPCPWVGANDCPCGLLGASSPCNLPGGGAGAKGTIPQVHCAPTAHAVRCAALRVLAAGLDTTSVQARPRPQGQPGVFSNLPGRCQGSPSLRMRWAVFFHISAPTTGSPFFQCHLTGCTSSSPPWRGCSPYPLYLEHILVSYLHDPRRVQTVTGSLIGRCTAYPCAGRQHSFAIQPYHFY